MHEQEVKPTVEFVGRLFDHARFDKSELFVECNASGVFSVDRAYHYVQVLRLGQSDQFSEQQFADAFSLLAVSYIHRMFDRILVADLFTERTIRTITDHFAVLHGNDDRKSEEHFIIKPFLLNGKRLRLVIVIGRSVQNGVVDDLENAWQISRSGRTDCNFHGELLNLCPKVTKFVGLFTAIPTNHTMIYPKIPLAQSIIQICMAKGVNQIVISPGSRNAPLTIGFASNPNFKCYSIADERSAGFFALGIAQQIGKPVALVCTSGSALLNYYPAVAEAFYSQIPLVVISADRPHDKIDIGDGQTIRQKNVFENHSLFNANLTELESEQNDELINEAINKAFTKKGPTHINAPFEEPLYETVKKPLVDPTISAYAKVYKNISPEDIIASTNIWNAAKKKLILVGVNEPGEIDEEILSSLAKDPSVMVMTETTSNLHHPTFLNNIDTIITPFKEKDFKAFQPEILITFGGLIVSKRIKAFLRTYKPEHHWHIDPLRAYNTFGTFPHHFETNPNDFFAQILPFTKPVKSSYFELGQKVKAKRAVLHDKYIAEIPFSDLKAFAQIIPQLGKDSMLQVSNSAAIRYAQLFDIDASISVYCNRGTSGIDGSTSTAIGAASASDKQATLITGDIGFLYDSNALWNNYIPKNFKIIVVNNGGGGIFRILPGHQENKIFNTFFETSHKLTAEHLAKMFGFDYFTANDESTLQAGIESLYKQNKKPCILEVFTPEKQNDSILNEYFKALV